MKIKQLFLFVCLGLGTLASSAQEQNGTIAYDFAPHMYVQGQFGGQYTLGEIPFRDLLSPNAQLSLGYDFTPVVGLRLSANAWQSKAGSIVDNNQYQWKWNYVAPSLDLTVNLSNWFGGFKPTRTFSFGLFGGLGANIGMNNDEAATANQQIKVLHAYAQDYAPLRYLWDDTQARLNGRAGITCDIRLCNAASIGVELQANTLSDKYNSKRAHNTDWYFNALVGLKINLGKTYKTHIVPAVAPEIQYVEKVVEKVVEKPVTVTEYVREPLRRDVFFTINSKTIVRSESLKLQDIADYLAKYPEAKVTVTGYADAGTGNDKINDRLAAQRAETVVKALTKTYGIAADRIVSDSKGSRVQPFEKNEKNRVSICIAE